MRCSDFEATLSAFLKGKIGVEKRKVALRHLESCPDCRETAQFARGDLDMDPIDRQGDFVSEVLQLTSGTSCGRSKALLCEFVDGTLSVEYSRVVADHLRNCCECSALFVALNEVADILPRMATIEPDSSFLDEVLAITCCQEAAVRRPLHPIRRFADAVFRRPRFSWEAAYVGTVLIMALWGVLPTSLTAGDKTQSLAGSPISLFQLSEHVDVPLPSRWILEQSEQLRRMLADNLEKNQQDVYYSTAHWRQRAITLLQESIELVQVKVSEPITTASSKVRDLLENLPLGSEKKSTDS